MKDMEKEFEYNKKLNKALVKRALGYLNKEVTEEFCKDDEGEKLVLTKRKVTKKNIPPDITAVTKNSYSKAIVLQSVFFQFVCY